jgi:toxin CptA
MHLPPAASWAVGSAPWQRGLLAALGLLGLGTVGYFCLQQPWGASSLFLVVVLCACCAGAAMGLYRAPTGQLRWDGERWHWTGAPDHAVTHLACVLDLQRCLLLRVHCTQGPVFWLWLQSHAMDARWLALRRAVVGSSQAIPRPQTGPLRG